MKQISLLIFFLVFSFSTSFADNQTDFLKWKNNFKNYAIKNGISEKTFDLVMSNVKFLPDVIRI